MHGVEISRGMLQSAARRFRSGLIDGRLQLHQASLEHLPLSTDGVDGVITFNTVYFLTDAELTRALAELERVLAPGGRLILGAGDPAAMARLPSPAPFAFDPSISSSAPWPRPALTSWSITAWVLQRRPSSPAGNPALMDPPRKRPLQDLIREKGMASVR